MATLTGPLMSLSARKSIGKTVTYASWKGIQYARQRVIPANPNTTDQQEVRNTFAWLQRVWAYAPALVTDGWNAYASGQPMTGRNAFGKFNVATLMSNTDLTGFIFSPAAKSGPVAAGISVTPGSTQLTVNLTAPSLPTGWTIDAGIAAAIRQQDPQSGILYNTFAAEDLSTPYAPVITGLTNGQVYVVGGWFRFLRPDGSFAYGPAIDSTGTPA